MGLDIYGGPLGRYWSGNWMLIVHMRDPEQAMSALGNDHEFDDGDKKALQEVLEWRDRLNREHEKEMGGKVDWRESLSGAYRTDKPGWGPMGALHLWAAFDLTGRRDFPDGVPDSPWEEPEYDAVDGDDSPYRHFSCNVWLPKAGFQPFVGPSLGGDDPSNIGSTCDFFESLTLLNKRTWQADSATLAEWLRGDEALAPDMERARRDAEEYGMTVLDAVHSDFEANARWGFAIVHDVAKFAAEADMPMVLDF